MISRRRGAALSGDILAAVAPPGAVTHENAGDAVDGSGMVDCPGFIDILGHTIFPLMEDGCCLGKITQGVTTEVMGEDWMPAPFGPARHRGRCGRPVGTC